MVRKHNYASRQAVPDRPEFFAEELAELEAAGQFGPDGDGMIAGYAREFARQDQGEVAAQVRAQVRAAVASGMSAAGALYQGDALGAAYQPGEFTAGEFSGPRGTRPRARGAGAGWSRSAPRSRRRCPTPAAF